ncbi:MAG: HD domain-containing protein [Candidatus Paceibacterota bacterium]
MTKINKSKIVIDPLLGIIDITEVLPLIDTKYFQSLGFKHQLGLASSIFPAATHTRKQHSLGAYERTKRLVGYWKELGFINENEAKNLPIYALYHDIGHGPFSHVTESLGSVDHNERGLKFFESLKDVFEEAGFDYDFIHDMFTRKNPLYLGVSDKNLGMEKLDYLERDAYYTIGERPGIEFLSRNTYFVNGQVAVSEMAIDSAKDIQDFYIKMYKHVYSRKKAAIMQRLIEKMTYLLVKDGLEEDELFSLNDFGLFGRFETSSNEMVKFYYNSFMKGVVPKLAIELTYSDLSVNPVESKKIKREVIEPEIFEKILSLEKLKDNKFLDKVENEISELVGIPKGNILLMVASKRRFQPDDLSVYLENGSIKKISNIYPQHFKALEEYGRSHLNVRVAVYEDYRQKVFDKSKEIKEYIIELAKEI